MSTGSAYDVDIELAVKAVGHAAYDLVTSKLQAVGFTADSVKSKLATIGEAAASAGQSALNAFTGVGDAVASLGTKLGMLGGTAVMGGVAYGVTHINAELEKTQISLAAIFNANQVSNGMAEGMKIAGTTMAQMRKDAAALPGEFKDLVGIFRAAAVPGLRAGMKVDDIRQLSAATMAAGAAAGMQMDVVAREMGMLIAGRAGGHNVLGANLWGLSGAEAEKFNKMSDEKRVAFLKNNLKGFGEAADVFGGSWEGLTSTAADNVKAVLGAATAGVFERAKIAISDANTWFDNHREAVLNFAETMGERLNYVWDVGRAKIEEWTPILLAAAYNFEQAFLSIWAKVEPIIEKLEPRFKALLGDPNLDKKIEHAAEAYGVAKVGMTAAPAFLSAGQMMAGYGLFGGEAAAGAAGAGSAAAGAAEAGAAAAGGVAAAPLLAAAAVAAASIYGAFDVLNDDTAFGHETAVATWTSIKESWAGATEEFSQAWLIAKPAVLGLADAFGVVLLAAVDELVAAFNVVAQATRGAVAALQWMSSAYETIINGKVRALTEDKIDPARLPQSVDWVRPMDALAKDFSDDLKDKKHERKEPKHKGVHVDKVEITVSGNDDPSRVARIVESHLSNLARHPRASRFVQNFSAST